MDTVNGEELVSGHIFHPNINELFLGDTPQACDYSPEMLFDREKVFKQIERETEENVEMKQLQGELFMHGCELG